MNTPQFAVQFGKTVQRGMAGGLIATPFIYTFVPRARDVWDQVKNPASLQNNHQDLGPVIPAGKTVDIFVPLDSDFVYKLISVKYSAYALGPFINPLPQRPI